MNVCSRSDWRELMGGDMLSWLSIGGNDLQEVPNAIVLFSCEQEERRKKDP